jgi:hypothetical protein
MGQASINKVAHFLEKVNPALTVRRFDKKCFPGKKGRLDRAPLKYIPMVFWSEVA